MSSNGIEMPSIMFNLDGGWRDEDIDALIYLLARSLEISPNEVCKRMGEGTITDKDLEAIEEQPFRPGEE